MPANLCVPFYNPDDTLTAITTAAVTGKRMVDISATRSSGPGIPATAQIGASDPTEGGNYKVAHCAAGAKAFGVAEYDAASGAQVGVIREGIVPVTSGAAIAAGAQVEVGANGKVITLATGIAVGKNLATVAGADVDAEIALYS